MGCGFAAGAGQKYCFNCGKETIAGAVICTNCGVPVRGGAAYGQEQKSKMVAGLLGIFLGAWGVHQFYLGKIPLAVIHLALGAVGVMFLFCWGIGIFLLIPNWIWGVVEGILILTGYTKTDGKGNFLKE